MATTPVIAPVSATRGAGVEALRVRTVPLALDLARLGSAAQFFSGLRLSLGLPGDELVEPFELARETMRSLQAALQAGNVEEAARLLAEVMDSRDRLRAMVFGTEAATAPAQVEGYLAKEMDIAAHLLRRIVDFYALSCPRDGERRRKMLVVATALAEREGLGRADGRRIEREFRRLGLLRDGEHPEPEQTALDSLRALRDKAGLAADKTAAGVEALGQEVHEAEEGLGDALYTLPGLSEAVCVEFALRERIRSLERCQDRSFDMLLRDLEGIIDEEIAAGPEPRIEVTIIDDDPEAAALIDRTGRELREAVAEDRIEERELYLDPVEVEAAGDETAHWPYGELLLKAAAARTVIEGMAKRHARKHQPPGVEPDPVPKPMAQSLVRAAAAIEQDLQDLTEQYLLEGETTRAKDLSRCKNRLSRSRLGLAILADVPAGGARPADTDGSGQHDLLSREEEALSQQVEAATLFRDALKDKKNPRVIEDEKIIIRPSRLKPYILYGILGVVALSAAAFHLHRWRHSRTLTSPLPTDFTSPVGLSSATPVQDAMFMRGSLTWEQLTEADRQKYARELWADVNKKGYRRMVLINSSGDIPLAVASDSGMRVFPPVSSAEKIGPMTAPVETPAPEETPAQMTPLFPDMALDEATALPAQPEPARSPPDPNADSF